jgi:hypothetical protein
LNFKEIVTGNLKEMESIEVDNIKSRSTASCSPMAMALSSAETMAFLMLLKDAPELVAGKSVLAFIDNIVALVGMVHGHSSACDLAGFFLAVAERTVALKASVWFEWIPSKSNPDGGLRVGVTDETAKAAGIALTTGSLPSVWPNLHVCDADEWNDRW